jgi:hypothetical protein
MIINFNPAVAFFSLVLGTCEKRAVGAVPAARGQRLL